MSVRCKEICGGSFVAETVLPVMSFSESRRFMIFELMLDFIIILMTGRNEIGP